MLKSSLSLPQPMPLKEEAEVKNFLAAMSLMLASTLASAQDFQMLTYKVDVSRQPKDLAETTADCLNNKACNTALSTLAAYVGALQKPLDVASIVGKAHKLAQVGNDRETERFDWNMPPGYQTCRINVDVVSTVPADGPRASLLDVAVHPNRVHIVTWTPIRNLGEGGTWVEANLSVLAVKDSLANDARKAGTCNGTADRGFVYRCRGKGGDEERVACGSHRS